MTIDELIEQLAQYPGDYEVVLHEPSHFLFDEVDGVRPGHYDESSYDMFTFNGNGKCVDVNAVAIVGKY